MICVAFLCAFRSFGLSWVKGYWEEQRFLQFLALLLSENPVFRFEKLCPCRWESPLLAAAILRVSSRGTVSCKAFGAQTCWGVFAAQQSSG